jgi:hypothetical protein
MLKIMCNKTQKKRLIIARKAFFNHLILKATTSGALRKSINLAMAQGLNRQ